MRAKKTNLRFVGVALAALLAASCASGDVADSGAGGADDAAAETTSSPEQQEAGVETQSPDIPADADPALVEAYEGPVQEHMPGLPFEILQGAMDEGSVTWYHLRVPASTVPLIEAFTEAFPFVSVEEYEDSGPPLFERFITEQRAGGGEADLMQFASSALVDQAAEEGFIAKYTPTSDDAYPAQFKEQGVWYPSGLSTRIVYMYNTDLVTEEEAATLEEYEGLWSGEFGDRGIAVPDGAAASNGQLFFYFLEKEFGTESWEALEELDPMIAASTPAGDALARGEVAVALASESIAARLYDAGAPVRWTVPDPVLVQPWPLAISEAAPNPNAAKLLMEFALSEEGQSILAETGLPSARDGVSAEPPVADEEWFKAFQDRNYYELDKEEYAETLNDVAERWKAEFQG